MYYMNTVRHLFNRSKRFGISKTENSEGQFLLCCIYRGNNTDCWDLFFKFFGEYLHDICQFFYGWLEKISLQCSQFILKCDISFLFKRYTGKTRHLKSVLISANNDALWNYVRALCHCMHVFVWLSNDAVLIFYLIKICPDHLQLIIISPVIHFKLPYITSDLGPFLSPYITFETNIRALWSLYITFESNIRAL